MSKQSSELSYLNNVIEMIVKVMLYSNKVCNNIFCFISTPHATNCAPCDHTEEQAQLQIKFLHFPLLRWFNQRLSLLPRWWGFRQLGLPTHSPPFLQNPGWPGGGRLGRSGSWESSFHPSGTLTHLRWGPRGSAHLRQERQRCGGGPVQCLLQVGLQQERDQLPLLKQTLLPFRLHSFMRVHLGL